MSVIWSGTPKKLYIITTDQGQFKTENYRLDYKQTVANLKKAGYTNINICCVGRRYNYI